MQKKEHTYVEANIKGLDRTHLNLCRVFYLKYPQICVTVSRKFETPPEAKIIKLI